MGEWRIYSLNDPASGECRYIGQTLKSLSRRRAQHTFEARRGRCRHLYNWYRKVLAEAGKPPDIRLIGTVPTLEMANAFETALITAGLAQGLRLTNDRSAGRANRISEETKAKIGSANKGKGLGKLRPLKANNTSGYPGVYREETPWGVQWRARVNLFKQNHYVGVFDTPEAANTARKAYLAQMGVAA